MFPQQYAALHGRRNDNMDEHGWEAQFPSYLQLEQPGKTGSGWMDVARRDPVPSMVAEPCPEAVQSARLVVKTDSDRDSDSSARDSRFRNNRTICPGQNHSQNSGQPHETSPDVVIVAAFPCVALFSSDSVVACTISGEWKMGRRTQK